MPSRIDIDEINKLSIQAGEAIMEIYEKGDFRKEIDYKSDNSPLTIADKTAHQIIFDGLIRYDKSIPIISEEGKEITFEERKNWNYFWLVDPLDGTKEFIKKNGEFTVNISLIENGFPIAGVIYIPFQKKLYFAQKGMGSFRTFNENTEEIKVSLKKDNLTAVGSRSHSSEKEKEILQKLPIAHFTAAGSSIKFCLVAEGSADYYYREGPTMEWDTAAGQAIVECAGGHVVDHYKKPFIYNKHSLLNPGFICNGSGLTL